ncbi:MAG: histidine kinase, partial [Actinomycetota bacterium]|nr:histidine kinase [Actinomycetota bacterium]
MAAALAVWPDAVDDLAPGLAHPFPAPSAATVLGLAGAVVLVPCVLVSVGDAARRLWRGRSPEREQLAWLFTTVVLAVGFSYLPVGPAQLVLHLLVPVAVAVGVVRHRLLDLQVVVRRTLLFAGLTGAVVAVFVGVTAGLSPLLDGGPLPVAVAAGLVAVGLTPGRELLQRGVDTLVYGHRRDPVRAVADVGRSVAEHPGDLLLPQVLRAVAEAVRSPSVVLLSPDGKVRGRAGELDDGAPLRLPLQLGGAPAGTLLIAPRTPRDGWSAQDLALLDVLVPQVAVVAHVARLNGELEVSRDRVVAATADERRRLRCELHDGLGPALSGVALGLEAAEACLATQPQRAAGLLSRLRSETQAAGREVRRLVDGLRPEALEGEGLADALEAFVGRLAETAPVRLALRVDRPLPPLPPEVEATAYRIVTEALTNVVRHSAASSCQVVVACEPCRPDVLRLLVEDDGRGLP